MKMSMRQENDLAIVKVEEEQLSALQAPELKERIETLILEGNDQMILDMSNINSMDRSCLGALVGVLMLLGAKGTMVIMGIKGSVKELFDTTQMKNVFIFADTENIARQKLH